MVEISRNSLFYWGTISVLASFHFYGLVQNLSIKIPIYVTILFVLLIISLLQKKILLPFSGLKKGWHLFFYSMQILFILTYIVMDPSWFYMVLFLSFIGTEVVRISMCNTIYNLNQTVADFTKERAHMNETFRIVRSERHEFLKHISAIHFLLEQNNPDDAKQYLDELVSQYEETNLSIKGERGTIAGVLHHMYQLAKKENIDAVYDIDVPISTLPINDKDLVTLIGNLLSNSIEACMEWRKKHHQNSFLSLQFYKRSGLYVLLCKNSSLPIPNDILDDLFRSYGNTTKEGDYQGLGTKLIDEMVKKHNGHLDFTYKNEEFTVKIKIPAIQLTTT